jgi:sulfur carrier protein
MNLLINGEKITLPKTVGSVNDLLNHFQLEKRIVIVELNHEIIEKAAYAETRLTDGDRIEIVHFVGGG